MHIPITNLTASKERLRVCVVSPNYYRSSGVMVAVKRIYASTRPLGIEQFFVNCRYGDTVEDMEWIPKDRYAEFDLMSSSPWRVAKALYSFASWLRANGITIVHVHHRRLAAILGAYGRFSNYRVLYTGQLTYNFNPLFFFAKVDAATAITDSVAQNMRATMRVSNIEVISNPVDFLAECPLIAMETQRAVCIGRLESVKGHEKLLRAWAILVGRGHKCQLSLVGEGTLSVELRQLAIQLGLEEYVEFRGFHANVDSEIERARFAVLASKVEGQGIVVLECAARGRASLLTDVDGLRDCLPNSRNLPNGIQYGNIEGLADALEAWVAYPDKVIEEGRRFFEFLKAHASSEIVAERYAEVYRNLAVGSMERHP